jgi:hypothetical protein
VSKGPPWTTEVIEGTPITVGQRQLTPIVKARSIVRRRVTFGTEASRGQGAGLVWLAPVAVIEHRPDGSERHIPIPDATATAVRGMVIGGLALSTSYLLLAASRFIRRHGLTNGQRDHESSA